MTARILLIRHGETEANAARVVQTPDVPLSAVGHAQALRLAQRLGMARVQYILASDLRRAVMTADCVRAATAVPLHLEPLLQERNYGDIRGRSYSTLDVDIFDPDYHPPCGESWEVFHARVDQAWEAVQETARNLDEDRALAVVTHGLVLHSLVSRHLARREDHSPAFANTSVTVVEPNPWRVTRLNCITHLDGGASPGAAA